MSVDPPLPPGDSEIKVGLSEETPQSAPIRNAEIPSQQILSWRRLEREKDSNDQLPPPKKGPDEPPPPDEAALDKNSPPDEENSSHALSSLPPSHPRVQCQNPYVRGRAPVTADDSDQASMSTQE